jgi:hypothetical protein
LAEYRHDRHDQSVRGGGGRLGDLVLRDAAGTEVYSRSLAEDGTFSSSTGTPGQWTVRVIYGDADGTVNFRLDKTT